MKTTAAKMKTGRKRILSNQVEKRLCASLAAGNSIATACSLTGISESSFFEWKRRGESGETDFVEFSQSVRRARAKAKQRLVAIIQRQAPRDWKSAAWLLERGFRAEYGKSWCDDSQGGHGRDPVQTAAPIINVIYRFDRRTTEAKKVILQSLDEMDENGRARFAEARAKLREEIARQSGEESE
jgi:transposase